MKFSIKQNDTLPSLEATLTNADGSKINLTGATVRFIMSTAPGTTPKVSATGVVVDAAAGKVRYDWAAANTAESGEFLGEFQITYSDGNKLTVPNDGYVEIEIIPEIGS